MLRTLTLAVVALAVFGSASGCGAPASVQPSVSAASSPPIPAEARQLVVVVTPSWTDTTGTLVRYERSSNRSAWRRVGAEVSVVVGRSGLGWGRGLHGTLAPSGQDGPTKAEGDGRSPAGVFGLTEAFGYAPSMPTGLPYIPSDADVECVDDGSSRSYNRIVRRDTVPADYASHEEMRLASDVYRAGVVVAHNPSNVARGGSCIFLHQKAAPAVSTSGCTAMAAAPLDALVGWLDRRNAPVLVQLPAAVYRRMQRAWHLPVVPL